MKPFPPLGKLHDLPYLSIVRKCVSSKSSTSKIPTRVDYIPGELVPDRVCGSYSNDFNINLVHKAILTIFAHRRSKLDNIQNDLLYYQQKLEGLITPNERKICESDIHQINEEIEDIQGEVTEKYYLDRVIPLLERYSQISTDESRGIISMWKLTEHVEESEDTIQERLTIIRQFLSIAREFIAIEVIETRNTKARCAGCGGSSENFLIDEELGCSTCPCGNQQDTLSFAPIRNDYGSNIMGKGSYEDRENFEKGLLCYQGKQKQVPPDKLYDQLEKYFNNALTLPKQADVLKLKTDGLGRKPGTSLQMMIEALVATDNTCYYNDLNLIMHVFWGWDLPVISAELYKQLIDDYDATQLVYYSIPDKNREASLNVQWRILAHLLARGYPARKDGFKLQTTRDSLEFHQNVWKIMCEKTGLLFVPII